MLGHLRRDQPQAPKLPHQVRFHESALFPALVLGREARGGDLMSELAVVGLGFVESRIDAVGDGGGECGRHLRIPALCL